MKRILVILMLYINLGVGQEVAAPLVIESGEPFLTEGELVRIVEEFVGGVDSQSVKTEGERVYEIGFPEEGKEESNIIEWDLHKIMCLFRESGNKQLINFVDTMAKSLHRFKPFGVF